MNRRRIMLLLLVITGLTLGWAQGIGAQAKPAGEFVWALHVTISPSWRGNWCQFPRSLKSVRPL